MTYGVRSRDAVTELALGLSGRAKALPGRTPRCSERSGGVASAGSRQLFFPWIWVQIARTRSKLVHPFDGPLVPEISSLC
jgi:hypothetical protein